MKKCNFCGAEILDEAVFCVHCNSALTEVHTDDSIKLCPDCQSECVKEAVVCVKCGHKFEAVKPVKKAKNKNRVLPVICAVLIVLGVIVQSVSFFRTLEYTSTYSIISFVVTLVGSVLAVIGFVSAKNRKLVGFSFILYAVWEIFTLISSLTSGSEIAVTGLLNVILYLVIDVIFAAVFLSGNKAIKKLWFVPIVLSVLICVISVIANINSGYYNSYGYYSSYFSWSSFLTDLVSVRLSAVLGYLLKGLVAKNDANN